MGQGPSDRLEIVDEMNARKSEFRANFRAIDNPRAIGESAALARDHPRQGEFGLPDRHTFATSREKVR
jgi:hypothetical protein